MRHLIMRLESPLMAFGGETIDNLGVIRWFPSASMLTGLLANALGWRRIERSGINGCKTRLVFAAALTGSPAGGVRMTDFQTAAHKQYRAKLDHAGPSRRPGWWHLPKSPTLPGLLRRHARNRRPTPGTGRRGANAG